MGMTWDVGLPAWILLAAACNRDRPRARRAAHGRPARRMRLSHSNHPWKVPLQTEFTIHTDVHVSAAAGNRPGAALLMARALATRIILALGRFQRYITQRYLLRLAKRSIQLIKNTSQL